MGNISEKVFGKSDTNNTENQEVDSLALRKQQFLVDAERNALIKLKKDPKNTDEVLQFKYIEKRQITHDTFVYVYEIPENLNLGLNLGQHIAIDANINGEEVSRKYTPTSYITDYGHFDLLIKVYHRHCHERFPEGGKMSQYLNELEIGSYINVRGPFGKLNYLGDGDFKILKKFSPLTYEEKNYKKVLMVAGGTGITPFYQIIQAAAKNSDKTEFYLMFGNKSTRDILLKKELEDLALSGLLNFKLFLVIDSHETDWTGGVGFITKKMLTDFFPEPAEDVLLLTCGPPVMTQKHLLPLFNEIGYKKEQIFDF